MLITLQYVNSLKYESTSLCSSLQFPKEHYILQSSQVLPMCPGQAMCWWRLVQSTGGMTGNELTRENCSTWRKTCPSCTLYTKIPHGLNWAWTWGSMVRGWQLIAWPVAFEAQTQLNNTYIFCSYLTVNTVSTRNANQLLPLWEITAVFLWES